MKKVLSFIIALVFSLTLSLSAQENMTPAESQPWEEIVIPSKDSVTYHHVIVPSVNIEVTPKPMAVNFKNTAESLTAEHITRIVASLESRGSAEIKLLLSLNEMIEDEHFSKNKVIYQAQKYYNLSEQKVKKALRRDKWITLFTYGLILIVLLQATRNFSRENRKNKGYIDLTKLAVIIAAFGLESFALWYLLKPIASNIFNNDYEVIKFLLQGV